MGEKVNVQKKPKMWYIKKCHGIKISIDMLIIKTTIYTKEYIYDINK